MKTITMFVVAMLILTGVVLGQQRFEDLRVGDLQAALSGNSEGVERLMHIIEEALAINPKNAKAKVTHGIGLLRRSGDAAQKGELENSAKLYQVALDEMEQAVQLACASSIFVVGKNLREDNGNCKYVCSGLPFDQTYLRDPPLTDSCRDLNKEWVRCPLKKKSTYRLQHNSTITTG